MGMALHWIFYSGKDRPDGVVIIDGADLVDARINAIGFEAGATFAEGHMLNPDLAAAVEPQEVGRLLSMSEANAIIKRFETASADATPSASAPAAAFQADGKWSEALAARGPLKWFFHQTPSGYVLRDANGREALRVAVNIAPPKTLSERNHRRQYYRIRCEPRPDGEVEIIGSGRLNQAEAALLLAQIAQAAREADARSGRPPPVAGKSVEASIAYLEPVAVGLLPGAPKEQYSLLTLHFGAAVIGIPIPNAEGRKLGQVLLAASADEVARH